MSKPTKILAEVIVSYPRHSGDMVLMIPIDPNGLSFGNSPTVSDVAAVATQIVLDNLKVKVTNGRDVLREIKAYRKADDEDQDDDNDE